MTATTTSTAPVAPSTASMSLVGTESLSAPTVFIPAFAVALALQQLLEVLDGLFVLAVFGIQRILPKDQDGAPAIDAFTLKKHVVGLSSVVLSAIAVKIGEIKLLIPLMELARLATKHSAPGKLESLDFWVTVFIICTGTEGINSIMKMIGAFKKERQAVALSAAVPAKQPDLQTAQETDGATKGQDMVASMNLLNLPRLSNAFNLLAIGDSVVWGQGLKTEHKFYEIVARYIERRKGKKVNRLIMAHSGAVIRPVTLEDQKQDLASIHPNGTMGEAPARFPSILKQARDFAAVAPSEVDLVLLDGGINDVDVTYLFGFGATDEGIKARCREYCYTSMAHLLLEAASKYDSADIVVTGYFAPISLLSQNVPIDFASNFLGVASLLKNDEDTHDSILVDLGKLAGQLLGPDQFDQLAHASRVFLENAHHYLNEAVNEVQSILAAKGSSRRIVFVDPQFGPQNSAYVPGTSFLWELEMQGTDPITNDEMLDERRQTVCPAQNYGDGVNHLVCDIAAIGHPNVQGANQYADRVIAALDGLLQSPGGSFPSNVT